jgi:hypothetical protein
VSAVSVTALVVTLQYLTLRYYGRPHFLISAPFLAGGDAVAFDGYFHAGPSMPALPTPTSCKMSRVRFNELLVTGRRSFMSNVTVAALIFFTASSPTHALGWQGGWTDNDGLLLAFTVYWYYVTLWTTVSFAHGMHVLGM